MIAQYDVLFTGQMVFALTALLGLASLGVKLFGANRATAHSSARRSFTRADATSLASWKPCARDSTTPSSACCSS